MSLKYKNMAWEIKLTSAIYIPIKCDCIQIKRTDQHIKNAVTLVGFLWKRDIYPRGQQ